MKKFAVTRKKLAILAIGTIVLALSLGLFVHYALPEILVAQNKHQVSAAFDKSLTPELKDHLRDVGVHLQEPLPTQCDNGPYSPSSPCQKYVTTIENNSFDANKWNKNSSALAVYLVQHGWEPYTDEGYQPIERFLGSNGHVARAIYSNKDGCVLAFDYDKQGSIAATLACSKYSHSPSEWL